MAEPAKHNAIDDEEDRELLKVDGEIVEVLDHGETGADEGSVDDAVGDIVEFIAQYNKEQQQSQTLDGFFCDASIQALEG